MHNFISFSSLLAAIVLFLLSSFILFKNPKKRINISFSFYYGILSIWSFGIFGLVSGFESTSYLWLKIMCVGVVFIPSFFLYFLFNLLGDNYRPKIFMLIFSFLFSVSYLLMSFTPYFFKGVTRVTYGYVGEPYPSLIFPIFVLFVILIMAYGHFLILKEFFNAKGQRKNQLYFIFIASVLFTIGGLTVVPTLLKLVFLGGFPLWNFTNIIYGLLIAFAITKHELMDIKLLITRSAAYGASIFSILLFGLGTVYFNRTFIPQNMIFQFISVSAFCLLSIKIFEPIRNFIQTPIEEKWITISYNSDKVLASISKELIPAFEKEQTIKTISKGLKENIKIKNVNILLIDKKDNLSQHKYCFIDSEKNAQELLNLDHPFIRFMINFRDISSYDRLENIVKDSIKNIPILRNAIYLPLSSSKELEGIVVLGAKISEDPYNEKDFTLFRIVMNQTTIVLDRISPYEQIKEDYIVAQKAVEKAQQMATLGALALQTEHEIQNPIAAIDLHAGLLRDHVGDKEYIEKFIDLVKRNSSRIGEIISNMREFGAAGKREKILTDINNLLFDKVLFLAEGHLKKKRISVVKEIGEISRIFIDPSGIEQVFINIILNAIQAMQDEGILTISTQTKTVKIRNENVDCVAVKIKDNGEGISKENLEKVFLPMFTTRYEGVGLGLSISYRIVVEEHGGDISIESEKNKGTLAAISLPNLQSLSAS